MAKCEATYPTLRWRFRKAHLLEGLHGVALNLFMAGRCNSVFVLILK